MTQLKARVEPSGLTWRLQVQCQCVLPRMWTLVGRRNTIKESRNLRLQRLSAPTVKTAPKIIPQTRKPETNDACSIPDLRRLVAALLPVGRGTKTHDSISGARRFLHDTNLD